MISGIASLICIAVSALMVENVHSSRHRAVTRQIAEDAEAARAAGKKE